MLWPESALLSESPFFSTSVTQHASMVSSVLKAHDHGQGTDDWYRLGGGKLNSFAPDIKLLDMRGKCHPRQKVRARCGSDGKFGTLILIWDRFDTFCCLLPHFHPSC